MEQAQKDEKKVVELEQENKLLREEVRFLRAKLRGRSTEAGSVLCDADQGNLFDPEELEESPEPAPPKETKVSYTRYERGKRKPIPEHFERVEILHDLSDDEKVCACGVERKRIGEETSEQLDMVPAKIQVLRHIRPKYACPCCEGLESINGTIAIAPAPKSMIPKSLAGPGLLAHMITTKFADAVPFYRQEKQLARLGIRLSRTTMNEWSQKAAQCCLALVDAFKEDLLKSSYVQIDETTLRVHGEKDRKNTTPSYMWVVRGGPPDSGPQTFIYQYSPTRSSSVAKALLADYTGLVHSDGYIGYQYLEKEESVTHLGCWAHARRKFAEAVHANRKGQKKTAHAQRVLSMIAKLYKFEKEATEKGLSATERVALREEKALPVLKKLRKELEVLEPKVPSDSRLGKAVGYALKTWPKLVRCFEYGEARLDTNLVENAIRPFVVGRKNWMLAGSPGGAAANGVWFSIIETAKANGWEPYAYLRFLFERLPNTAHEDLRSLLPYNAKPLS